MKKKKAVGFVVFVLLIVVLMAHLSGCGNNNRQQYITQYNSIVESLKTLSETSDRCAAVLVNTWGNLTNKDVSSMLGTNNILDVIDSMLVFPKEESDDFTYIWSRSWLGHAFYITNGKALTDNQLKETASITVQFQKDNESIKATIDEISASLKQLDSEFGEKYSSEIRDLREWYGEASAYAKIATYPEGNSYNTFSTAISNYKAAMEKYSRQLDLH